MRLIAILAVIAALILGGLAYRRHIQSRTLAKVYFLDQLGAPVSEHICVLTGIWESGGRVFIVDTEGRRMGWLGHYAVIISGEMNP